MREKVIEFAKKNCISILLIFCVILLGTNTIKCQDQINSYKTQRIELSNEIEEKESSYDDLLSEYDNIMSDVSSLEDKISRLQSKNDKLTTQRDKFKESYNDLKEDYQKLVYYWWIWNLNIFCLHGESK